jgi:hypothetical protein
MKKHCLHSARIYRNENKNSVLNRNDKEILTSLMKMKSWFSYEDIFGDPIVFNYFTRLALAYDRYAADSSRGMDSIFKACKDDVARAFNTRKETVALSRGYWARTHIGLSPVRPNLRSYFISCSEARRLDLNPFGC